ncbi:hypothetical protein ACQY0O_004520 [Thecaphora frezii]
MASQPPTVGSGSPLPPQAPAISPYNPRKARHARTPTSLTLSIDRRPSISSNHGDTASFSASAAVFASMGLNPFRTDPDELFATLSVKQVESYENAVRQAADQKQAELRTLVGERYQDLLGTANTIIDMADSSAQLCERLDRLHTGVVAAGEQSSPADRRDSRRLSSFGPQRLAEDTGSSFAGKRQEEGAEQLYSLGASLKMIMDAPEYVWRSIEKGKTLHAAWAFMLARTVWWNLMERSLSNDKKSTATERSAEPPLPVDVKAAFPFIERQWQGLVPMRKQIVQRAVHLLSDFDLSLAATADQLAAIVLLDNMRIDQTFTLFLSQRQHSLRKQLRRRASKAARSGLGLRRESVVAFDEASASHEQGRFSCRDADWHERAEERHLEEVLQSVIRGFSNTVTHLLRAYFLPQHAAEASLLLSGEGFMGHDQAHQPYLVEVIQRLMQAPSLISDDDAVSPRLARRSSVLQSPQLSRHGPSLSNANPVAQRKARRKSSYSFGLPPTSTSPAGTRLSGSAADQHQQHLSGQGGGTTARVSTYEVLHSLPSSHLLLRFLPLSVLNFTPYVELVSGDDGSLEALAEDLRVWCCNLREDLFASRSDAEEKPSESVSALLSDLGRIASVARLRTAALQVLSRCKRVAERKMFEFQRSSASYGWGHRAIVLFNEELQALKVDLDAAFHQRMEAIYRSSLETCSRKALQRVEEILSALHPGRGEGGDSERSILDPLASLFSDEAELGGGGGGSAGLPIDADRQQQRQKRHPTSSHPTQVQLVNLDSQLKGRTPQLESVTGILRVHLSRLSSETVSYLNSLDLEEPTRAAIGERLRNVAHSMMLGFLERLEILILNKAEQPYQVNTSKLTPLIEIEPRNAFVAQLASSLTNGPIFQLLLTPNDAARSGESTELQSAARRLVQASLQQWSGELQDLCMDTLRRSVESSSAELSSDKPSRNLLGALSLLSEATLKAGVALDRAEVEFVTRSVLLALQRQCESDEQCSSIDGAILGLLLDGRVPESTESEAIARVRLLLLPLSRSPLTLSSDGKAMGLPRPTQKVEDVTSLARASFPRFEAI